MQNKINNIAIAWIPLSQNPWNFRPVGLYFLFCHKSCLFLWVWLRKISFFRLLFYAVLNSVKINFSSKFLNGTPYSTADFSPREFEANRSVTVKALSFLDAKQLCHTEKLAEWTHSLTSLTTSDRVVLKQLCQQGKLIQIAE